MPRAALRGSERRKSDPWLLCAVSSSMFLFKPQPPPRRERALSKGKRKKKDDISQGELLHSQQPSGLRLESVRVARKPPTRRGCCCLLGRAGRRAGDHWRRSGRAPETA